MHPAQRLTGAVRLCALVHEGVAVLQELHRRLLDVLNSLARHGCRGTELRENLPREERHSRPNAPCLVQAGPTGAEAVGVSSPCAHSRDVASLPDLGKETRILKGVARVPQISSLFCSLLSRGEMSSVTYCSLQRRPGRVPGFTGAYHHCRIVYTTVHFVSGCEL